MRELSLVLPGKDDRCFQLKNDQVFDHYVYKEDAYFRATELDWHLHFFFGAEAGLPQGQQEGSAVDLFHKAAAKLTRNCKKDLDDLVSEFCMQTIKRFRLAHVSPCSFRLVRFVRARVLLECVAAVGGEFFFYWQLAAGEDAAEDVDGERHQDQAQEAKH